MAHLADKDETKATVSNTIRDLLYSNFPETYDCGKIDNCPEQVFEYVYNRYSGLVSTYSENNYKNANYEN